MIGVVSAATLGQPQQQSAKAFRYPAPLGGVDSRVSIAEGNLDNCVYTYNLLPAEFGMIVRRGYREWQTDVESVASTGVTTIIPFNSVTQDAAKHRLFAVTREGIWNTTDVGPVSSSCSRVFEESKSAFNCCINCCFETLF